MDSWGFIVEAIKLEDGLRIIGAGFPLIRVQGHGDSDVPAFWHLV